MTKFLLHILLLIGLLLVPAVGWADFQAGKEAYYRGDYETALGEWQPLAEQGDAQAQNGLGVLYQDGKGVPQDFQEALRWYRLAATQEYAKAQFNLGNVYVEGKGGPQDYTEAMKWYRLAADQGHAGGQINLGLMFFKGQGVAQNYVHAYMWATLAAEQGVYQAVGGLESLEKIVTPAQIAEAQRLAREWKAKGK